MKFEDWLIGAAYAIQEKSCVLELGVVVQKYQTDQVVAIDFRKSCGAEYLYIVDDADTYVIHRPLQEVPDTTNRVAQSRLGDRG